MIPIQITRLELAKGGQIIPVDNSWASLIQYVRTVVPFGEVTITFKDGKPHEATRIVESVRFQ